MAAAYAALYVHLWRKSEIETSRMMEKYDYLEILTLIGSSITTSHDNARRVVEAYCKRRETFGLFLRNFDIEAFQDGYSETAKIERDQIWSFINVDYKLVADIGLNSPSGESCSRAI